MKEPVQVPLKFFQTSPQDTIGVSWIGAMLRSQTLRHARALRANYVPLKGCSGMLTVDLMARTRQFNTQRSGPRLQDQHSPMKVFVDTFKKEWKKSSELNDQIKQLKSATDEMGDSEAFKHAKEAYKKAQEGSSSIAKTAAKAAEAVGGAAEAAWESPVGKGVRKSVEVTADTVDKVMEPVRNTKAYQEVKEVFDEGASSYGLYETKEERKKRRLKELKVRPRSVKADHDAGMAVVVTDAQPTNGSSFKEKLKVTPNSTFGKLLATLSEKWEEADNPLLVLIRSVINKVGGVFAETENAKVVKAFQAMDPNFTVTDFNKQLREYIVPEVLDAYVNDDEKVLKMWLSEAPYNIITTQQKQLRDKGIWYDGRILDIRGVDVVAYKMLEPSNIPVLVTGSRVQEISLYRDKQGKVVAGSEDDIVMSSYAMVITRIPEEMDNKDTDGWKILEFVKAGSRSFT